MKYKARESVRPKRSASIDITDTRLTALERVLLWAVVTLLALVSALSSAAQEQFAQWPELQKGQAPDSVFQIENLDSVNLYSGNLSLDIPLGGDFPVTSEFSYGLSLVYNANPWEALDESRHECRIAVSQGGSTNFEWVPFYPKTLDRLANAGAGWMVSLGSFEPPEAVQFDVTKPPFTYVAPDGSKHGLHPELHFQGPTFTGVYHSRDGSFIRMTDDAPCQSNGPSGGMCRKLEFPDGSSQEFHHVGPAGGEDYRPTLISDAFGNQISITYDDYSWEIIDNHLRSQKVEFVSTSGPNTYTKVERVVLSAFGGEQAIYTFQYQNASVDRHQYELTVSSDLECLEVSSGANPELGPQVLGVDFLHKVILPDGSFYEMSYYEQDMSEGSVVGAKSAALEHIRLNTGLHYRYDYSRLYGDPRPANRRTPRPQERVFGVHTKQRYIVDDAGVERDLTTWLYEPKPALFNANGEEAGNAFRPCFQKTDVRFYEGDPGLDSTLDPSRHNRHYFSLAFAGPSNDVGFISRRTLPFTACPPEGGGIYYTEPSQWYNDGLFLSEETLDPVSGQAIRSVWVDYETDAPSTVSDKDGDRRLIRRRTVYHDDGDRWIETRNEDFDGLGHYRKAVELSNFESTDGARTTFTAYNMTADNGNPSSADFTPQPSSRWLLELYEETCLHQGSGFQSCAQAQQRTLYDFDSQNGFLHATRRLRGSSKTGEDVLTLNFDAVGDGEVTSERTYGGDREGSEDLLPVGSDFSQGSAPQDQRIDHQYSFGVLARSEVYDGTSPFLETLDQTIDRNTGLPSGSRDAAGLETLLDYDEMGRLTKIETKKNNQFVNVATQLFRYTVPTEANQNLTFPSVIQVCGTGSCPRTPLGFAFEARTCEPGTQSYGNCTGTKRVGESRYFYDRQGRLVDERRLIPWTSQGQDIQREVWRQTDYDLADRKAWSTDWHAPDSGFDVFFTVYRDFDVLGRPRTVEQPDDKEVTMVYFGDRITQTTVGVWTGSGESQSTTTHQSDGFGRLVRVTEPAGTDGAAVHTTYRYDQEDRLTYVCQGDGDTNALNGCNGQDRSFTHDGRGWLISEQYPEIDGTIAYTYDGVGNMLRKDLSGVDHDLTYLYDAADRPTQVRDGRDDLFLEYFYGRANQDGQRVGKLYQARRHNWVPTEAGSSTSVDEVVTETFDYSAPGDRLAAYTVRSSGGASFRTEYAYDWLGNVVTLDYPECDRTPCAGLDAGPTVAVEYALGQVLGITGWIDRVRYWADGRISRIEHSNLVTDEYQRNQTTWKPLEKIQVSRPGVVLWDTGSYQYDGAGNIYQIGSQESFVYDRVSRLTSATVATTGGLSTESQQYDIYGNILSIQRQGEPDRQLSPSTSSNRLGSALAGYDAAGNMTLWNEDGRTFDYEYAPDNRITTLEGNSRARAFLYTASGERFAVLEQGTGEADFMTRDAANSLLSRFRRDAAGEWQRSKDYVRVGDQAVATEAGGTVRHLHRDHLGSTRLITDSSGDVVGDLTTYHPYGTYAFDGTPDAEEIRFTGHERDDVGLASANVDYMHARYYIGSLGRFMSVDPINSAQPASPQTWNKYVYSLNNPVKYNDPDGRFINLATGAVGAVIGGATGAVGSVVTQLIENGGDFSDIDGRKVAASTLGGATSGGLAGLTGGASIAAKVVVGVGSNVVGGAVTRAADGDETTAVVNKDDLVADAVAGGLGGFTGSGGRDLKTGLAKIRDRLAASRARGSKGRSGFSFKRSISDIKSNVVKLVKSNILSSELPGGVTSNIVAPAVRADYKKRCESDSCDR